MYTQVRTLNSLLTQMFHEVQRKSLKKKGVEKQEKIKMRLVQLVSTGLEKELLYFK